MFLSCVLLNAVIVNIVLASYLSKRTKHKEETANDELSRTTLEDDEELSLNY